MPSIGKNVPFSELRFLQNNQKNLSDNQGKISNYIEEISTGQCIGHFDQVQDLQTYLTLRNELMEFERYEENAENLKMQLNSIKTSLGGMHGIFDTFLQRLVSLNNTLVQDTSLNTTAQNMLNQVEKLLNRKGVLGEVFTGTQAGKAVDFSGLPPPLFPSIPDPSFYLGDTEGIPFEISPSQSLTISSLIKGPATEYGVRALNICAHVSIEDPQFFPKIREAQDLLRKSMGLVPDATLSGDSLATQMAFVDNALDTVDRAVESNTLEKLDLESKLARREKTDLIKTVIKLEGEKTKAEMSLALTAQKLREINLVDIILRQ